MTSTPFSRQPKIPGNASPAALIVPGSGPSSLSPEVYKFRAAYVMERNIWQNLIDPEAPPYRPDGNTDGTKRRCSIEDREAKEIWSRKYSELEKLLPRSLSPFQYLRILFWVLRAGSVAVPQPKQLTSSSYLEMALEYHNCSRKILSISSVTQLRVVSTGLTVYSAGYKYSKLRSIYQVIVDRSNGLSPLFRYALARTTMDSISAADLELGDTKYVRLIDKSANRHNILACLEYTVFPDLYDELWGSILPSGIRSHSVDVLSRLLQRFS